MRRLGSDTTDKGQAEADKAGTHTHHGVNMDLVVGTAKKHALRLEVGCSGPRDSGPRSSKGVGYRKPLRRGRGEGPTQAGPGSHYSYPVALEALGSVS